MLKKPILKEIVNAQIEVNRACFKANCQNDTDVLKHFSSPNDVSDEVITRHINIAIFHLQKAIA